MKSGLLALCLSLTLAAHADENSSPGDDAQSESASRHVMMHKNPGCGCCDLWADHLRAHGFTVDTKEDPQIFALKDSRGIPQPLYSCHTAMIDGYFVEGHVPARDILSLLTLKLGRRS